MSSPEKEKLNPAIFVDVVACRKSSDEMKFRNQSAEPRCIKSRDISVTIFSNQKSRGSREDSKS
jgi:hypothetical protein